MPWIKPSFNPQPRPEPQVCKCGNVALYRTSNPISYQNSKRTSSEFFCKTCKNKAIRKQIDSMLHLEKQASRYEATVLRNEARLKKAQRKRSVRFK